MKIEKAIERERLCTVGDFIHSKESDITYVIIESKEGFLLVDTLLWQENKRATSITELLEGFKHRIIIPGDDATLVLKSSRW